MKPAFRPYVSCDIETTGIDEKAEVLQIAAVLDDGVSPINDLKTVDLKIKYKSFNHAEPFALMLNAGLIKQMTDKELKDQFVNPEEAAVSLIDFMNHARELSANFDEENDLRMKGKVICAGKNFASFDDPRIRNFLQTRAPKYYNEYNHLMSYKTLDVGSMYYLDFGYNPSLSQINELTGRTEVTHQALDDALDVVYAVRKKANLL
jgi:oligoribonuclease (3'-5' exoribonuclease)